MKAWTLPIKQPSRTDVIIHCINDVEWQDFRLSLKGLSTSIKLKSLLNWLNESVNETDQHRREVQVNNYLGALKRGGQISAEGKVLK